MYGFYAGNIYGKRCYYCSNLLEGHLKYFYKKKIA